MKGIIREIALWATAIISSMVATATLLTEGETVAQSFILKGVFIVAGAVLLVSSNATRLGRRLHDREEV